MGGVTKQNSVYKICLGGTNCVTNFPGGTFVSRGILCVLRYVCFMESISIPSVINNSIKDMSRMDFIIYLRIEFLCDYVGSVFLDFSIWELNIVHSGI